MGHVVSLGSINVDMIRNASDSDIAEFEKRFDWFPDRGQTVTIDTLPDEHSVSPDLIRHGGKGANQAVAAARGGAKTAMLGKVGPDHGRFDVLSRLEENDVDTEQIGFSSEPTGTAHVFVDSEGDNRIVVCPGANGAVDRAYIHDHYDIIVAADCLLLQNEISVEPAASLLSDLASEPDPPTVILDPAPAQGAEQLLEYASVTYLTPNEHEYETLQPWLDRFDGVLVRKRGSKDLIIENDERYTITPPSVDPVDTTGAGDILNGFMAAQIATGTSPREAIEIGAIAGSLSTHEKGARSGIPSLADVRTFQESHGRDER